MQKNCFLMFSVTLGVFLRQLKKTLMLKEKRKWKATFFSSFLRVVFAGTIVFTLCSS